MKDNGILTIPFVAHESAMNRMERANRRLWIVILIIFIGMMVYFFLPTEVSEEYSQNTQDISDSQVSQSIGE